ncbi:hypothetical protein [Streptomyces sp. NPDC047981]|uniref:hypothetical protein n=1 Tax=Streptomyces sp. NPDC047981 TaxID=3154610 RepID=UPI003432AAB3
MSYGPEVRRGGNLPFGMFCAQWMCDPRYSANARTLYGILITYADTQARHTAMGKPYRRELARQLGVSLSTLDRTLLELEVGGLIRIEERKNPENPLDNDANVYHLLDAPLMWQGNGTWIDPLGPGVKAADVAKQVTEARRADKREAGEVRKGGVAKGISTKAVKAAREAAALEEGGSSTHAATPGSTHAARVAAPVLPNIQSPVQTPSPDPDAPSGRSPAGCRQASTGSREPGVSGSAASGRKPARLSKAQRDQVQAVRALLPRELDEALGARTPPNVAAAVLTALAVGEARERTVEQLVEHRVLPRWNGYWASKFFAGELPEQPYGPLLAMVKDTAECGSLSCDDRVDIHTGLPCTACATRAQDQRADRDEPKDHPPLIDEPPVFPAQRDRVVVDHSVGLRPECGDCGRPFAAETTETLCTECRPSNVLAPF